MKILLDTHIFLWFITGNARLSEVVKAAIRDSDNDVYLSAVSNWEIVVKYQLGKLPLPKPPETYIPEKRELHQISSLPLDEGSVAKLTQLPALHRDPFDQMLICQAMQHELVIVTVDRAIQAYPVKTIS